MKEYIGRTEDGKCTVTVSEDDGASVALDPRNDLRNHSPDGFAWGYMGSGPSQLALAMLADYTDSDEMALRWYMRFKEKIIALLEMDRNFIITGQEIDNFFKDCFLGS
jgi:hypothetical protein